jgi:hypothetical protein
MSAPTVVGASQTVAGFGVADVPSVSWQGMTGVLSCVASACAQACAANASWHSERRSAVVRAVSRLCRRESRMNVSY